MKQTATNVHALGYGGALMINPAKPVVQATLMFTEENGVGQIMIMSDSIIGGMGLCHLTQDIVDGIKSLIEEVNEAVNEFDPA